MATNFHVTVFNSRISTLFQPGGDAWGFTKDVTAEIEAAAIATCPDKTGNLKSKHVRGARTTGIYGCSGSVGNNASYAAFVHEGTANKGTGYIYPTRGKVLKLPVDGIYITRPDATRRHRARHNGDYILRSRVRGQKPQPWISEAASIVLSRHGVRTP